MNNTNQYTFQTVVVPPKMRAEFTARREELNATDKLLAQAIWNVSQKNQDAVLAEVRHLQEQTAMARAEKRATKAAAKAASKPKKEPKSPKRAKKALAENVVESEDDDVQCVVVDGTK